MILSAMLYDVSTFDSAGARQRLATCASQPQTVSIKAGARCKLTSGEAPQHTIAETSLPRSLVQTEEPLRTCTRLVCT